MVGSNDPTALDMDVDPRRRRMRGTAIHGNMPFDVPFITEIAPNLWQGGCEDGLVLPHKIKFVVSLYPWEKYKLHDQAERYEVTMYDSLDQDTAEVERIATFVNELRKEGPVLVHCQAGLNRSSLIVARALMLEGMTNWEAIELIRQKRSPACLCNQAFERYLMEL